MIPWIKKNWLTLLLGTAVIYLLKNQVPPTPYLLPAAGGGYSASEKMAVGSLNSFRQAPPTDAADRLVVKDTTLSLQVKNVADTISEIEKTAKDAGGYMVESDLSKPEFAASGNITVRVPEDKRSEALATFKNLAIKIVSEHVSGYDVTDQYTDLQAQLEVLNKTKTKFEEILDKATQVPDLLNVQRELINLQTQIDQVKGQQKYYEQSAKLSKVTIYLSTDDLSLPYAPDQSWRPVVIFRQAVRSLIGTLRSFGSLIIWLVVYLPILLPLLGLLYFLKKKRILFRT